MNEEDEEDELEPTDLYEEVPEVKDVLSDPDSFVKGMECTQLYSIFIPIGVHIVRSITECSPNDYSPSFAEPFYKDGRYGTLVTTSQKHVLAKYIKRFLNQGESNEKEEA